MEQLGWFHLILHRCNMFAHNIYTVSYIWTIDCDFTLESVLCMAGGLGVGGRGHCESVLTSPNHISSDHHRVIRISFILYTSTSLATVSIRMSYGDVHTIGWKSTSDEVHPELAHSQQTHHMIAMWWPHGKVATWYYHVVTTWKSCDMKKSHGDHVDKRWLDITMYCIEHMEKLRCGHHHPVTMRKSSDVRDIRYACLWYCKCYCEKNLLKLFNLINEQAMC